MQRLLFTMSQLKRERKKPLYSHFMSLDLPRSADAMLVGRSLLVRILFCIIIIFKKKHVCDDDDNDDLDKFSGTKDCPLSAMRQVDELCDDGDLCTVKDRCQPDGKCVGKFLCECKIASDCWPIAFRKREVADIDETDEIAAIEQAMNSSAPMRVEDLCQELSEIVLVCF